MVGSGSQAVMLSANSGASLVTSSRPSRLLFLFFNNNNNNNRYPFRFKKSSILRPLRASSDEPDCNVEECAPDKEVGKVSVEWLAEEKTKVLGTFPPRNRGWTGYVEKDTAGQTNIYSVEPAVYVAESAISSGTAGSSADGSEKAKAIVTGLALVSVAAAASILPFTLSLSHHSLASSISLRSMDFWGVEVKSGDPCPVEPGEGRILHLSQACLGEGKKDKRTESVYLYATIDGKKLVLGTLSPEKFPQQQFDLVFNKKFELSHNWKHGSVYFYGYRCDNPIDETEDDSEDELEDELPVIAADSGKSKSQAKHEKPPAAESANTAKPVAVGSKQKVKIVEPKKDVKTVEEIGSSDDDFETDSSEYASESDEDEDSDSENEGKTEDDDEDKETPKKVEPSKKRPAESATETPGPDKKAKSITPQITDTKKGNVHVATPHPSKKSGKTPANQPNQQTPKSAGSHPCKSCNRSFNSENALESHTKAKHSAGK